jgi:acetyltransferase-like isoleucine patch superfamily enzyme
LDIVESGIVYQRDKAGRAIAAEAQIGSNVQLGHNVVIHPHVRIEDGAVVMDNVVLGRRPQTNVTGTRQIPKTLPDLVIGSDSIIGTNSVIYLGSTIGPQVMVGDLTSIREGCDIGEGAIIGRGVMALYDCRIGNYSRIQDQVQLVGNAVIEAHVFIGMGVMMANDNEVYLSRFGLSELKLQGPTIRKYAVIGTGATLLAGIEGGAMVAAGAVVTKEVAPWTVVAGVPARFMHDIPDDWRLKVEGLHG